MTKLKHSPLPWIADIQEPYGAALFANGLKVGLVSSLHPREELGGKSIEMPMAANAAFIVRACNGWYNKEALRARIAELEEQDALM